MGGAGKVECKAKGHFRGSKKGHGKEGGFEVGYFDEVCEQQISV
jgi:hypothetical protein